MQVEIFANLNFKTIMTKEKLNLLVKERLIKQKIVTPDSFLIRVVVDYNDADCRLLEIYLDDNQDYSILFSCLMFLESFPDYKKHFEEKLPSKFYEFISEFDLIQGFEDSTPHSFVSISLFQYTDNICFELSLDNFKTESPIEVLDCILRSIETFAWN